MRSSPEAFTGCPSPEIQTNALVHFSYHYRKRLSLSNSQARQSKKDARYFEIVEEIVSLDHCFGAMLEVYIAPCSRLAIQALAMGGHGPAESANS